MNSELPITSIQGFDLDARVGALVSFQKEMDTGRIGNREMTMGLYWNGEGPHQELKDALRKELVPFEGKAATLEGELLNSSDCLAYAFLMMVAATMSAGR